MVKRLKKLGLRGSTVVADKGYYNGQDLARVKRYRVKAVVSRQKPSDPVNQPVQFHNEQFHYDASTDTYTCPVGKTLYPHNKRSAARRRFFNKKACSVCPYKEQCASGQQLYRTVTRGQYSEIYEEANKRFEENKELYKLRQQLVEHPFGTVKRALDGGYFLVRIRKKVRAEVALLFLAYDLKRVVKVLGFREIMARLEAFSRILSHSFSLMLFPLPVSL